jgi:hypothetical protein
MASRPSPTTGELTDALVRAFVKLTPSEQHLVVVAYRLLASGLPAEPVALAEAAGWAPTDVVARLATWPMVYLDDRGRLVGLMGLSSQKASEHRVEIAGLRASWAWCALDPMFIVPVLGASARVTSKCPVNGDTIEFNLGSDGVRDLTPASTVVSSLVPDREFDENVVQTFCHFVHYFASTSVADRWTAEHPGTFTVTAADADRIGHALAAAGFSALFPPDQRGATGLTSTAPSCEQVPR